MADEKERQPPQSDNELLCHYARGDRDFNGAILRRAELRDANLRDVKLNGANLREANLLGANFSGAYLLNSDLRDADLSGANLGGADLSDANLSGANLLKADLSGANLSRTDLRNTSLFGANLFGANLSGATLYGTDFSGTNLGATNFSGANLAWTLLLDTDLSALCDINPPVFHGGASTVDFRAIAKSLHAPKLKDFLQRTGMPEIVVEYMVECARAIDGSLINKLLQSTYISYGEPDEPFAQRLYEALHRNGVTTFFFLEHAKPGQRIGRVVRENVESYDRVLLVCSKNSLDRPGVLYEIEETLERERRAGGADYLIPVILDDHLLSGWKPERPDVARALQGRVVADFRNADRDEEKFNAGLRKLIGALKPPDVTLWRPLGSLKPTEP